MSGGLAPSKSTVYVSNIPFSLTNNDLHKVFEKYGKVVKVTVVKEKESRKSKGVAFVLFLERESAYTAVRSMNNKQMFGRTIKCSIAVDNGRASEFIRRKNYVDKTKCYECGEFGHMSYACPKNALGEREPPPKKERKRKKRKQNEGFGGGGGEGDDDGEEECSADDSDIGEDPELESYGAAIRYQQNLIEEAEYREKVASGNYAMDVEKNASSSALSSSSNSRRKIRKSNYFSDEEDLSD